MDSKFKFWLFKTVTIDAQNTIARGCTSGQGNICDGENQCLNCGANGCNSLSHFAPQIPQASASIMSLSVVVILSIVTVSQMML